MQKVHRSAVCLIPPRPVWQQIQDIRVFNDKSFLRWPPHINLLYPFQEDRGGSFAAAAERCSRALQEFRQFQIRMASLRFFEHGRSCTLWVDPESEELCRVQSALVEAFPECTDLSDDPTRGITRFTPHLSLGQWRDRAAAEAAVAQLGASWRPVEFEAGGVALISRQGFDDPFTLRYLVPFGGGPVQQLDLPYVGTVGPHEEASADFGLGRWRGGVWNFAYGANMCPSKLEGSRGLRALESAPARLPGWRLSFTHRGAMGNLERLRPGDDAPHVHGVLHLLSPADYGKLANCEHEYRPEEVEVVRCNGQGTQRAVAFVTPHDRCIRQGLPPPGRYLGLLQEGARHWDLDAAYVRWLDGLPSVDGKQRGEEYYMTDDGRPLPALPKNRTGAAQQRRPRQQGGRGGREKRRGSGDGGGARGPAAQDAAGGERRQPAGARRTG